jgi:tryptophanyl-tRNA synthetase
MRGANKLAKAENGTPGELAERSWRKRVLSGMRPTGPLHIGHYFGALSNWLKMQEEYDCFFFVADWHAMTTHYEDTSSVADNTLQIALDWLSVGLDPAKSTIFVQSQVLEHAELHLLLSMITPLSWLERVPTYKEQIENLKGRDLATYGFLGYPLLQSADIVIYGEPRHDLLVPVGEDQVPHVELTREIVRRFNFQFGMSIAENLNTDANAKVRQQINRIIHTETFDAAAVMPQASWKAWTTQLRKHVGQSGFENALAELPKGARKFFKIRRVLEEPAAMLTETPRLPGTDGRRMAKSYGNAIWLSEKPDSIRTKVRNMMTDPQRVRRTDPGRPEVCPVFAYHKLFSTNETVCRVDKECRTAEIGCVDCKGLMADALVRWIEPIQAKRRELEAQPERVWESLKEGSDEARKTAKKTMKRVREAIFGWERARKAAGASSTVSKVATGS